MKNKNIRIGLILLSGLAAACASYYFLIYKPQHAGQSSDSKNDSGTTDSQKGITGILNIFKPKTPAPAPVQTPSNVGKTAYANRDGVKVFNADMSIYKTAKNGEWLGTIQGAEMKSGYSYYKLSGGRYVYPYYVKVG